MFDDIKTQFNQQISEIRHQSSYLSDKLTAISKTLPMMQKKQNV